MNLKITVLMVRRINISS